MRARVRQHETFLHISKHGIPVLLRLFANILITSPSAPSGYGEKMHFQKSFAEGCALW